jgi:DNA-binding MarR family transcriptional regulator
VTNRPDEDACTGEMCGCGTRHPADPSCPGPVLPSGANGPLNQAIVRVAKLHHLLARQLLRHTGLHPGQEVVMMHLWEHGAARQVDLIRVAGSDAATMTRMVRRLERAGFVRRRPSPTDRRAVIIEATPASQALRGEIEGLWPRLEQLTTGGFTQEEYASILELLDRLAENLGRATS